jgi:hypothetical protein
MLAKLNSMAQSEQQAALDVRRQLQPSGRTIIQSALTDIPRYEVPQSKTPFEATSAE